MLRKRNEKKGSDSLIIEIGVFLIILGILFDDFTTLVLFTKGYGVLETNPLYNMFGILGYLFSMIIIYSLLFWFWLYIHKTYYKLYSQCGTGYKIYDLFIFVMCVFIIFTTITKMTMGFNNIGHMIDYSQNKVEIENAIQELEVIKAEYPKEYRQNQMNYYFNDMTSINLGTFWFCVIFGYLLFRVGYRASPYDAP